MGQNAYIREKTRLLRTQMFGYSMKLFDVMTMFGNDIAVGDMTLHKTV